MNRIPASVLHDLRGDATKTGRSKIIRWSLQSLSGILSNGGTAEAATSTNANVGGSGRRNGKSDNNVKDKGKANTVSNDVARIMLLDTKRRLAVQRYRFEAIKDFVLHGAYNTTASSEKDLVDEDSQSPRGVVRAVNQDLRQLQKQKRRPPSLLREVSPLVENLEYLHVDTYRLVHGLFSSPQNADSSFNSNLNSPVLERFASADRTLVASTFTQIRSRHASTVETLAAVVTLLREHAITNGGSDDDDGAVLDGLVDRYLRERLGVQLLCDHYLELNKQRPQGTVSTGCNFADVLAPAVTEATTICSQNYAVATPPEVVEVPSSISNGATTTSTTMTLIKPWIHHVLVEVLKNAMASTVRQAMIASSVSSEGTGTLDDVVPPPIEIAVVESDEWYDCHVTDRGVGFPPTPSDNRTHRHQLRRVFRFAETSSQRRYDRLQAQQSYASPQTVPMAGLGVGLSLSQMMMQMFGGDLFLCSPPSHTSSSLTLPGCTATIRIHKNITIPEQSIND